ncbi:transglycosylase domain-containing protein [Streptomyces sp. NPDC048629]|uniref:transglycosylase domain-containing protein n=1 Tax=Streptomyces sp. NPDC048629 TaxID=3154824 RepID=UPI0034422B72
MRDEPQQPGWEPRDRTVHTPPTPPTPPTAPARPKRRARRRLLPSWRTLLGAFLLTGLLLAGGFTAGYLLVDIPAANATAIAQSNVYLYADGTQLARDGEVNRENVRLDRIPAPLRHAVLAAEDRDFHSERAVDPQAMLRAAWNTVTGKGKQSGSTITQQYVKNYYLGQERTVTRKVKEFFIAIKLDREKSKDEIFEGYLNTSYFGRNAYGVQAAARAYYGQDVEHLDTAQSAYLATLLNAPSVYDVATHPENRANAVARWHYVLDGMVAENWLTPAERAAMKFPAPHKARPVTSLSGQRGYVVQAVEDYLTGRGILDENTLARGGYRITTTLEKTKQDALVRAVDDQVMSRLDRNGNETDRNVRVGGVAVVPGTGHVVAMYGGIDYTKQYVNNATRRDYQVGSTFKPIVFTAAVEHGAHTQDGRPITPNAFYDGSDRRPVEGWNGPSYAPENEDGGSYGQISVREATDKSVNSVYAQMAVDVGPTKVRKTAVALGLPQNTPDLTASPSIALGPATASVLDMAKAYATLANHGEHGTYTLVAAVSKDGQEVELPAAARRQAVAREAADTTTAMLRGVVEGGTGTAALAAGRPAAGKTGTAEDDKAAWFAGYTPDLATVVAMMGQDPDTGAQKPLYGAMGLPRVNGGGAPAEIWAQFTREALEDTEATDFDLRLAAGAEDMTFPDGMQDPFGPGDGTEPGQQDQQDGQSDEELLGPQAGPRGPQGKTPGGRDTTPGAGRQQQAPTGPGPDGPTVGGAGTGTATGTATGPGTGGGIGGTTGTADRPPAPPAPPGQPQPDAGPGAGPNGRP